MAHSVTLTWVASTDAVAGYNVFRSDAPGTPLNGTTLVTALTYVDNTVVEGQSYTYFVEAVSAAGVASAPSNSAVAVIPPAPPTNLVAVAS